MKTLAICLSLVSCLALSACGNKGSLVLPSEAAIEAPAPEPPAPAETDAVAPPGTTPAEDDLGAPPPPPPVPDPDDGDG